jgi:Big-like domain-containing protein
MSAQFDQEAPTPPDSERGRPCRPRRWRSARIAAGGVAAAAALLVAVPSVASALPIPEQGSAAQHAPGSPAHRGHPALPLMAKIEDTSCAPPAPTAARKFGSRRVSPAGRVSGTSGKLGAGVPEETSLVADLLKGLKDNAISYAEDDGFGWVLSLLGNQQPSVDPAEIDAQFAQVDNQLTSLANAQYQDCQAITQMLASLKIAADRTAYQDKAGNMASGPLATLNTFQQDYHGIVTHLQENGGNVNALQPTDLQDLVDMLSGGTGGLQNVINQINALEGSAQPGDDSMAQLYGRVLADQYGYDPYTSHIFPAAFVNDGYTQQEFYATKISQAVFLYANAAHLDFTAGGQHYTPDPSGIVRLVKTAQADIAQWSAEFSDGPSGDGTQNWVSQGIGPLPSDTVLDYRVQNHPMLWTTSPVNLSDGTSSFSAPYYCGTTAQFCYAVQYPVFLLPVVGDLQLAAPSPQPLPALIANANYDGLTGWRVPTLSDWNTVKAGAGSTNGTGLGVWGPANQLPMFTPQTVASHWTGTNTSASVIGPLLYATGDSSQPYGVLTDAYPAGSNIFTPMHSAGPSGESDLAGRLFLVQDFQPSSGPATSSVGKHLARTSHAPVTHTPASHPAAHVPAARGSATARLYNRSQAPRTDLAPTTFSTPALCSASSSGDTYTVPAGAGMVEVKATGGAGGNGANDNGTINTGGDGGAVTETFPATPGQTLYVQVGGAGHGQTAADGGGAGGATQSGKDGDTSGGGGGASGVSSTPGCSNWLAVGGGAGGGGAGLYVNGEFSSPKTLQGGSGGAGCAMTGDAIPGHCPKALPGMDLSGMRTHGGAPGGDAPNNAGGAAISGVPSNNGGSHGGDMHGGQGGAATAGNSGGYTGGGGGGGGGAGYFGGGGGGAAGYGVAGGGGGGGASFAIPGGSDIGYGLGNPGQGGSVTITPLPPAPPTVLASASASGTTWGQPVTLTATVPASATGTVTFNDGAQSLGTAPILDGTATLQTPATLGVGSHQIVASYSGDTSYAASQSDPVTVTVGKATPPMALTISGTMPASGQAPKSLVVQLPADATGSVGFYDASLPGADKGIGVAPIVNGQATLTSLTKTLPDGAQSLYAWYGGDGNYGGGGSNPVTVIVGSASGTRPGTHHGPATHHQPARH